MKQYRNFKIAYSHTTIKNSFYNAKKMLHIYLDKANENKMHLKFTCNYILHCNIIRKKLTFFYSRTCQKEVKEVGYSAAFHLFEKFTSIN